MSKVNVSLQGVFSAPANVPVTVKSVLVGSQNVLVGTVGALPEQQTKRTDSSGRVPDGFSLLTGRYQISAQSPTISGVGYSVIIDVPNDSASYEHTQLIVSGAAPFSQPVPAAAANATVTAYGLVKLDLAQLTAAEAYELTAINYDSDGVITTATVLWRPDGSAGVFTTTLKNPTFLTVDAYTITHADSGKTVTQAAVTRDANGNVTIKPALTVT